MEKSVQKIYIFLVHIMKKSFPLINSFLTSSPMVIIFGFIIAIQETGAWGMVWKKGRSIVENSLKN